MGTITTIILVVLTISFFTFVAFFGRLPALRHTPIAWLHRFMWISLPNGVFAIDQRLTSGRFTTTVGRFVKYILYDKHPTILIFYFLLLSVSEYMYLPSAWPRMSSTHRFFGAISIALPYIFLYLAAFSDPGAITPGNHAHQMGQYPYDFTLFHPGRECRTCHLLKPARSKHCSVCKRCIARLDHHCIFINNCVGAGNHHWFVLLLLSTGILLLYGGVLGIHLLSTRIRTRYPSWRVWLPSANGGAGMSLTQWLIPWSWGLQAHVGMGSVTLLALLTSPLVWGLLAYHVWLIYGGTTTNESMKWSDWKEDMNDGLAFKRRMAPERQRDPRIEPGRTRWPAEAEQIVVRTTDGRPPPAEWRLPGIGEWERVWELRSVENLYDLGFWDNLTDIFIPEYRFRDLRDVPLVESRGRTRRRHKTRGGGRS